MHRATRLGFGPAAAVGILALGACGDSSGPNNRTTINISQAEFIGDAVAAEISGITSGLTGFGVSGGSAFGGFFAPGQAGHSIVRLALAGAPDQARPYVGRLANLVNCTPSQSDPTDTDQDGVPDNNTITFTASNCTDVFVDQQSGLTVTSVLTGSINIQDTEGAGDVFGYGVDLNTLKLSQTIQNQQQIVHVSFSVDGGFGADVQGTGAGSYQQLDWDWAVDGEGSFHYGTNLTAGFTPVQGQTIDPANGTFPSGSFNFGGAFVWSGSTSEASGRWGFTVLTTAPLAYDGTCQSDPPFSSGTVRGQITARTSVGFLISFIGCGQPPVISNFDDNA